MLCWLWTLGRYLKNLHINLNFIFLEANHLLEGKEQPGKQLKTRIKQQKAYMFVKVR